MSSVNTINSGLVELSPIMKKLDEIIGKAKNELLILPPSLQPPSLPQPCTSPIVQHWEEPNSQLSKLNNEQNNHQPSPTIEVEVQTNSPIHLQSSSPSKSRLTPLVMKIQPAPVSDLLDSVNWLSDSNLDGPVLPDSMSFSMPIPIKKPIFTTNSMPTYKNTIELSKRSNTTSCIPSFELSDPISQNSSSPIKQPIAKPITQEAPPKPRTTTRKAKTVATMSDENGFLYTAKQLREANRVTRKKDELLSEMLIHFPNHIYNSHFKNDDVRSIMEFMTVETYETEYPIIYWTRKLTARYNKSNDVFIPCPPTRIMEKTIVLYYKAENLVRKLYDKSLPTDIKECLRYLKQRENLNYNTIIIIEGYEQYLRKLKNVENNNFRLEVLRRLQTDEHSKKRKLDSNLIQLSQKEVQDLINSSQIELGVNFFPIKSNQEVVEWMYSFTYTIAFALYDKWERNQSLANLGIVKSGTDAKSTYINSICHFKLMTKVKAERLHGFHASLYSMYKSFQQTGGLGNDGYGRNIIPPTAEQALCRTLLSDDPNEVVRK